MKKLWILFLVILFGGVSVLQASALTDAANREKARRAALHLDGRKVKVFTNADIENLKSPISYSTNVSTEIEEPTAPEQTAQAQNEQDNQKRDELKQEREQLQEKAQEAQKTIDQGGGYFTVNIGNQYREMREARQRINEIDDQLKKMKKDKNGESGNQGEEE
jgi:gamma-glutamylcysteine synthetase